MNSNSILIGKKLLIVDDEIDILDSLVELLDMCKIDTADSFDSGKKLLENQEYDLAILDIMGVEGFDLLKIANDHKIPALMLTANALSEENLKKAAKDGAAYFVPKDRMVDINLYVSDIFQALAKDTSPWEKFFERLGGFYDNRFGGINWREKEKEFWKKKMRTKF